MIRTKIAAIGASLALGVGSVLIAQPAQAVVGASFRICRSSGAFAPIAVWDTGSSYEAYLYGDGACTSWLDAAGIRVDTDPTGRSHSYKLKVTDADGNGGSYGPCHTNSDNHASDPPNPGSGNPTRVYYRNYDHGDCTN